MTTLHFKFSHDIYCISNNKVDECDF